MSKQTSIITLKGTLNGISFYKMEGENLARIANGPSKERIESDPNFIRTRENNAEFGGSATVSKAFRRAFIASLQNMADSRITSRLTQLFKAINAKGAGTRGKRAITISANKDMVKGLEFNKVTGLNSVLNAPYGSTVNGDRSAVNMSFANFVPTLALKAPQGATHFRLVLAIGTVSDYLYNDATAHYEPIEPTLNELSAIAYEQIRPIDNADLLLTLNADLGLSASLDADVSLIQCLGVEFFQQVNGQFYILAQGNAMKVLAVY
jgi:hypothetical protein